MSPRKTIGFDVDGVLADLHPAWYAPYNKDYNDNLKTNDVRSWGVHEYVRPDCGKKIYEYLKNPHLYDKVKPIKGAIETIATLKKKGFRIVYATSTPIETSGRKYYWLVQWGFVDCQKDYVELSDKSLFYADALVDDYEGNLENFVGRKILFSRPWNKAQENNPNYCHATSWKDVLKYCYDV